MLSEKITEAIDDLMTSEGGWWQEANRNKVTALASTMHVAGIPEPEIISHLENVTAALKDEFGV